MAKRFFYVCAGLLMLAAAYHLGATKAESQASGNQVVTALRGTHDQSVVFTSNGDVYQSQANDLPPWTFAGNIFSGAVATQPSTWGGVKERFSH